MPSKSKAQQRFMGLVHAYKKGEVPASKVSQAVKDAAKSLKKKSAKDFASTKHKGLPNKVRQEVIEKLREMIRLELESCGYVMSAEDPNYKLKSPGGTGKVDKKLKELAEKMGGCLCEKCWKGYKIHPTRKTKELFGKKYPNCVKAESVNITEDGHTDVASAKRSMKLVAEDAQEVLQMLIMLNDEDSLPSWWMNKIAVVRNDINKARDYLKNSNQ